MIPASIRMPEAERGYNFEGIMKYFAELKRAMEWLAAKPDTLFLGQAVAFEGTAMTNTLRDVEKTKLFEMPVAEEFQMGLSIGLAVNGTVPISIFPRWNFLLLATNQLVNHLDKLPLYSHGEFTPKVIIRTAIGSERPIHPQIQHTGDFTDSFRSMLKTVDVVRLDEPEGIFEAYVRAYERKDNKSTILVEYGDYYNEK
jgi:pyruvate/2-oxoglutarate/acetoin dehydrogenase E1 component